MRHLTLTLTLTLLAALALLASHPMSQAQTTTADATPAPKRDLRYVVLHKPGPRWVAGKSPFEQPGLQAHIDHYRQLLQQGKLVLGGPFMDGAAGGMMLPEAGLSEAEITEFAQADPAVKSGLLLVEVRPWMIGMRK